MIRLKVILTFLLLIFPTYLLAQSDENPQLEALEHARDELVLAISNKTLGKITDLLADNAFIVLENGETFSSKEEFKQFVASTSILDKNKVKKLSIENIEIDKAFQSFDDKHFLAKGTANFIYQLVRGKILQVPVHWMVTMTQNSEGQWQISSYQATINVLDNPLIDQMRHDFYMICFISLIIGFILGVSWKKWMKKPL